MNFAHKIQSSSRAVCSIVGYSQRWFEYQCLEQECQGHCFSSFCFVSVISLCTIVIVTHVIASVPIIASSPFDFFLLVIVTLIFGISHEWIDLSRLTCSHPLLGDRHPRSSVCLVLTRHSSPILNERWTA